MKKKLLIFDMDGVLFDSIGFSERFFLEKHTGVTEKMYKEIHSGNYYEEAKKYDYLKIAITEGETNKEKILYAKEKIKSPMFAGTKELLEELHNLGYILVLNTSAYERNCLPLLEKSKIKELFDFVAAAEVSKSKIEKFKLIENKYNASKEDVLFITDALGDLREADESGISTIVVTWGVHDKTYFAREIHNNLMGVADTVEELRNFIFKNNIKSL